jgi:dipeptidyl aminopeptidase/acylaminoacyl peptidase
MHLVRAAVAACLLAISPRLVAQPLPTSSTTTAAGAPERQRNYDRQLEVLEKKLDDLEWRARTADIAVMDKWWITSKPPRNDNPTGQGAGNPLKIPLYTFVPKSIGTRKAPLLILVHGYVHGSFDRFYTHILRELLEQGYVVVAPEYRGSTGYGGELYSAIDYGGAEIDDVKAARDWAVETMPNVDASRVGVLGWSHGGYLTLFNAFNYPDAYKVAYAGVPVSDLVQRMGYKGPGYQRTFTEFIGKDAVNDPAEYRRRSPVNSVAKLRIPLLIHTNTIDEDVHVMEVEHLIAALTAAKKTFEYKIYEAAPGGHEFNRIDTPLARASRKEIWAFLARHLRPGS